jgi:prophage maintenance system killer protein
MQYLAEEDFVIIFTMIYERFTSRETVPNYSKEKDGIEKLTSVLEGAKMDVFYPYLEDKVAHVLIQISKGHFFSNGNKRVALAFALAFAWINKFDFKRLGKDEYERKLKELFSKIISCEDYDDFLPEEFAYYNLSIIVADSNKYVDSFDELKEKVVSFLKISLVQWKK